MPVSYDIVADRELAVIHLAGLVTAEEVIEDVCRYHADPRYSPGTPELAVMHHVTDIDMDFRRTVGLYHRMRDLYVARAPNTALSICAPEDLAYGMSRMFQAAASMSDALHVGVHRTEAEALGWLGRAERRISDLPA